MGSPGGGDRSAAWRSGLVSSSAAVAGRYGRVASRAASGQEDGDGSRQPLAETIPGSADRTYRSAGQSRCLLPESGSALVRVTGIWRPFRTAR
jgi:hypothetical protein